MRKATAEEIAFLEQTYKNRRVRYGDLHEHSASGGTSDGTQSLSDWKVRMEELKTDFTAILDHKQVRHMYLPEWDPARFVNGTEPGTRISDAAAEKSSLHYNMILPEPEDLWEVLEAFPEFGFEGGREGHFSYPDFTRARFGELMEWVKARGGFFVVPHPKQVMVAEDPLQYWFRDGTGIEAFYIGYDTEETRADYALWRDLLARGKRVWACAGGDTHAKGTHKALTTVYTEASEHVTHSLLPYLRRGDFTCGNAGFRFTVGETRMGGSCAFTGQKLILSVGDIHPLCARADHTYRLDLFEDEEIVGTRQLRADETAYVTHIARPEAGFYRAELTDETEGFPIALSNPVWNR